MTDASDTDGSSSEVTLRYAIDQAVAGNQDATIGFAPSLADQTIALSQDSGWSTTYGKTAFVVNGAEITINGAAAPGLVISGDQSLRPFVVTPTGSLMLENITVSGGRAQGGAGGTGGDAEAGGGGGAGLGGAVYDDGGVVHGRRGHVLQ